MSRRRSPRLPVRARLALWWAVTIWVAGAVLIWVFTTSSTNRLETGREQIREIATQVVGAVDLDQVRPEGAALLLAALEGRQLNAGDQIAEIRREARIALVVLVVGGAGLGYVVAGRMLRPVSAITATARRLTGEELGERIALRGPPDELHDLAAAFNEMLDRIESSFQAQRAFGANASHELRTPLQVIRSEVDIGLADHPDEEITDTAEAIRGALDRADDVIDSLLVLARGEQDAEPEQLDLAVLADRALADHTRGAGVHGVVRTLDPAPTWADPGLCQVLVDNLVDNALRHRSDDGAVYVATAPGRLVVANDGPILSDEQIAHLGERFYRPDGSRSRETGGSGLGLSIARMVAKVHGADLEITGRTQGGLEVVVTFPEPTSRA